MGKGWRQGVSLYLLTETVKNLKLHEKVKKIHILVLGRVRRCNVLYTYLVDELVLVLIFSLSKEIIDN